MFSGAKGSRVVNQLSCTHRTGRLQPTVFKIPLFPPTSGASGTEIQPYVPYDRHGGAAGEQVFLIPAGGIRSRRRAQTAQLSGEAKMGPSHFDFHPLGRNMPQGPGMPRIYFPSSPFLITTHGLHKHASP